MYRSKPFRAKPWATIEADLEEAAAQGPLHRRASLMDGAALIASSRPAPSAELGAAGAAP